LERGFRDTLENYDITVIGGGPAGYVAAIRASQLGAKVCLIEKGNLGGVCLNAGCVPTKVLLHTSKLFNDMRESHIYGISAKETAVDWASVQIRKNRIIQQLVNGVSGLLKKNRISVFQGKARFINKNQVEVIGQQSQIISSEKFIICSGSRSVELPLPGLKTGDGRVFDSTGILDIEEIPNSLIIVGGGVIGLEFAFVFASLGCKVTIVEMLPQLVSGFEPEQVKAAMSVLLDKDVSIHMESQVLSAKDTEFGKQLVCVGKDKKEFTIEAEKVLLAVGRKASTEGMNLEKVNVKTSKGAIVVNELCQTSVPNIYAAGDCTGKHLLAYVAYEEGSIAAENALGAQHTLDYNILPRAVFIEPQLASVGVTEKEAKEKGIDVKVGMFGLQGNGKALIQNAINGMVKIVSDKATGEILGVHLFCPSASELIASGCIALKLESTVEEIALLPLIHPTVSEAIKEAALSAMGRVLHM
jgi:dihydrolipoamide dehydrogenase